MWQKISNLRIYGILVSLFILSVCVRLPNIDRAIDGEGWVTAHTLVTLQIWSENAATYHFSPVYTYPNRGDKNIPNLGGISDREGNYYYISYPPFTFIFPYIVGKIFGLVPSSTLLQMLNLMIHGISAFLIYQSICFIYHRKERNIFLPALIGLLVYLFSPGNLWFHGNIFFVDEVVQFFFVLASFLSIRITQLPTTKNILLFGLSIFLMVYTEWIGVLFSGSLIVFFFLQKKRYKHPYFIILTIFLSCMLSLLVTLYQYGSIAGLEDLIAGLTSKYLQRSGYSSHDTTSFFTLTSYMNIAYFYMNYYLSTFVLLFSITLLYIWRSKILLLSHLEYSILYISSVPVVLHYIVFFNFNSNHSFSTLKSSLFLSMFSAIICYRILSTKSQVAKRLLSLCVICWMVASCLFYYAKFMPLAEPNKYQIIGQRIAASPGKNEVVFVCNYPSDFVEPQLLYYAKRNIILCDSVEDAKKILRGKNLHSGKVYLLSPYLKENKEIHIDLL